MTNNYQLLDCLCSSISHYLFDPSVYVLTTEYFYNTILRDHESYLSIPTSSIINLIKTYGSLVTYSNNTHLAELLAEVIKKVESIEVVMIKNNHINLRYSPDVFSRCVIGDILLDHGHQIPNMAPLHIVLEFSSPNTNKALHLGHLRNNCIGDFIARILKYKGHHVTKINLLNDRGIHICKSMLAYQKWSNGETPINTNTKPDKFITDYYIEFEKRLKQEYDNDDTIDKNSVNGHLYFNNYSKLGKEAKQMLIDYENQNPDVMLLWRQMRTWALDGLMLTYSSTNIVFDSIEYESNIYQMGKQIINDNVSTGKLEMDVDGSIFVDLNRLGLGKPNNNTTNKTNINKKCLLRSNGTSMYMTQDIGVINNRIKQYGADELWYVVDVDQRDHFASLFKLQEYLFGPTSAKMRHFAYGTVSLSEGKMSTRNGTIVFIDDLLVSVKKYCIETKKDNAKKKLARKNKFNTKVVDTIELLDIDIGPELDIPESDLNILALSAIKFSILSAKPQTDIIFDIKKSLQSKGKTGIYVSYNYTRIKNIFVSCKIDYHELEYDSTTLGLLTSEYDKALLLELFLFRSNINYAYEKLDSLKVVDSIYKIASVFSTFYKKGGNLLSMTDPLLLNAKLQLIKGTSFCIELGLNLLGIECLERI